MIADQMLVDESHGALTMGERFSAASTATFPDSGFILGRKTSVPIATARFHTRQGQIDFVIEGSESERQFVLRVLSKLMDLVNLPDNWDSYGAKPIALEVAVAVAEFLPAILIPKMPHPNVVPTAEGGIQLEWHRNGVDLELEFESHNKLCGYAFDRETGQEWEGDVSNGGLGPLADALTRIAKN